MLAADSKRVAAPWILLAVVAAALVAYPARRSAAQALSPQEALERFKMAEGFEVELYASEPLVRQPVTMTFDDRGRMWVIQYLQYPNPAGLTPVEVDRYLRTKYDRVPEPPPLGPPGADKVTILEDTDGDGQVDRAKDFVTGLNLASALALGNGGVYVAQAPYLLFYPDRNGDDIPDGDPQVLLKGFGMEDAHAVVNSLEWGPDGWLYGAQGSTVTADIRGIGFQQGLWRYHPETKRFELFSEGGGNTWGLDFDGHGNAIAGTNYSHVVCLHQVQGGYYVKNFVKHGALHNPYTYGYFEHATHTGQSGGHVTCGGIVYQGGAFPITFNDVYIGANLLSNAIYYSALERRGSTYETRYLGTLLETDDIWFRPIDCLSGPDGAVYVADWYDKRANHVIPEDTWDKTNGRIWRIVHRDTRRRAVGLPLSERTSEELVTALDSNNVWYRRAARRLLTERGDVRVLPQLRRIIDRGTQRAAIEALWTLYSSGGWDDDTALKLLAHANEDVRAWTVRLVGDDKPRRLEPAVRQKLVQMAGRDESPTVRSQLACTAKRLRAGDAMPIVAQLMRRAEDADDPHIPLLVWWAIEDKAVSDPGALLELFAEGPTWLLPMVSDTLVERLAKRYLAEQSDAGYQALARLMSQAPRDEDRLRLVAAMDQSFSGYALDDVPAPMKPVLEELRRTAGQDSNVLRFALRMGHRAAYEKAVQTMVDPDVPTKVRLPLIAAVAQTGSQDARERLIGLPDEQAEDAESIQTAAISALRYYADDLVAREVLDRYEAFSPGARRRAIALVVSREAWSHLLLDEVAAGRIATFDLSVDDLREMLAHQNDALDRAIEAHWGKIRPATPGEKMSYVPVLSRVLGAGRGDPESGHKLFMKHCGVCHTLHGEGEKIGPDLTTADRKNRDALLLNILDPSGTIRPEYVSHTVVLVDGRVLTGLIVEKNAVQITLVDAKQQKTTIPREDIKELQQTATSLMPERLLEQLEEQELRDLFSYLQSDGQVRSAARTQE
ncbi:MAG: dehydrogenase [Planctomycetota bacterium]|nr:MAG: dehydrogenase [Planctomycetota bacterium]